MKENKELFNMGLANILFNISIIILIIFIFGMNIIQNDNISEIKHNLYNINQRNKENSRILDIIDNNIKYLRAEQILDDNVSIDSTPPPIQIEMLIIEKGTEEMRKELVKYYRQYYGKNLFKEQKK